MRTKKRENTLVTRYNAIHEAVEELTPHLYGFLGSVEDFREIRIKARADGTCLAIAKGFGPDGGETVCFGVGYDAIGALLGIDGTIQSGSWKVDEPWSPNGKGK